MKQEKLKDLITAFPDERCYTRYLTFGRITSKKEHYLQNCTETVRAVQQTVDGVMNTFIKAPSEFLQDYQ